MSITILTPYKLFFITQADCLFALMKDGRVLKIKQTPYFANISSDKKTLSGISFDGENTHILSIPFGFDLAVQKEIASLFGYFYYPCLAKGERKVAIIEADLLKPRPEGELRIYKKKIKKWYLLNSFDAKMKPPFILAKDDSVIFIDKENNLTHFHEEMTVISTDVNYFSVSPLQTKVVYATANEIKIYSFLQRENVYSFPVTNVTALCFDATEKEILYATSQENRFAIYSHNIATAKTTLLIQTPELVNFLLS